MKLILELCVGGCFCILSAYPCQIVQVLFARSKVVCLHACLLAVWFVHYNLVGKWLHAVHSRPQTSPSRAQYRDQHLHRASVWARGVRAEAFCR